MIRHLLAAAFALLALALPALGQGQTLTMNYALVEVKPDVPYTLQTASTNTYKNSRGPRQTGLNATSGAITSGQSYPFPAAPMRNSCAVDATNYLGF